MDFGFGSLVTKFEEHVGPRPTRVLLWFAAIAAFVICIKAIITEGVIPVVNAVKDISSKPTLELVQSVGASMLIAAASGLVFVVVIRVLVARHIERATKVIDQAEALVSEARLKNDQLWELIAEAEAATQAAKDIVEADAGELPPT